MHKLPDQNIDFAKPQQATYQPVECRGRTSVCLNMIVRDEGPVIIRSLSSVKNLIDYWVIVDTGSVDDTREIIKAFMKDIPGELHVRPWVNFEHNRNEALFLARNKGDYLLFIDADEQLDLSETFTMPLFDKDYYSIAVGQQGYECLRVFLINSLIDWRWKGVIHEEMTCSSAVNGGIIERAKILAHFEDGHRTADPKKFFKDAQILEEALQNDPTNARYLTFLSQSYLCAKDYVSALKNFTKRALMGGREEEVFWSLYQIGCIQEQLNYPSEEIINSYCRAHQFRPSRAEPLFRLARYYCINRNYVLGHIVCKSALSIPYPNDVVHVDRSIYEYRLPFLLAHCAFGLGKTSEANSLFKEILNVKNLPAAVRDEVTQNILITESCPNPRS